MRPQDFIEQLWRSHKKGLLAVAILLLVNLALYVGLEQTLVPQVTEQETHYIRRQAEVRQIMREKGSVGETPEQLFVLASRDLEKFRALVPAYGEFTGLIEELLVISSQSGLNLTQIKYTPDRLKEVDLLRYSLSFNVTGNYEQIKKFIHTLEQSRRLVVIKKIGLNGAEGGSVSLSLNLETFFRTKQAAS